MSTILNNVGIVFPDATVQTTAATGGGGGVTGVTAVSPLTSSGGATPAISLTGIVPAANGGTGVANTATLTITGANKTLDQAVNSGSAPTFVGTNFSNIPGTAISTTTPVPAASGGTGVSSPTGVLYFNGSSAASAATGAQIATLLGSNPVGTANNLAGGTANQIPYQTAAGTTSFLPTGTAGGVLVSNGSGAAPSWGGVAGGLF